LTSILKLASERKKRKETKETKEEEEREEKEEKAISCRIDALSRAF